jgi:hypothetical protein
MQEHPPNNPLDAEVDRLIAIWRTRIDSLPGQPVAIEALWDGDTSGWFLCVSLITRRPNTKDYDTHSLELPSYGGDIRLFQGTVPPWPEAEIARRVGEQIARTKSLEVYFPSPKDPDDDCPHWWERDQAIPCRSCGKPLVRRSQGSHLPADQCYPCHLAEERQRDLIADKPGHDGNRIVYCFAEKEGRPSSRLFINLNYGAEAVARLRLLLKNQQPPVELSERIDAALTESTAVAMRDWLEKAIDDLLSQYVAQPELPEHFTHPQTFTWRGEQRVVQTSFNDIGEKISSLLGRHAFFAEHVRQASALRIIGNGGVTYRDVSFLCWIVSREGQCRDEDLRAQFPFLRPDAIEATLAKLKQNLFLERFSGNVRLLSKGWLINVAGP